MKDTSQLRVGDKVIGNKLAAKHYTITTYKTMWTVTKIINSTIFCAGEFEVICDCFDLVKPKLYYSEKQNKINIEGDGIQICV